LTPFLDLPGSYNRFLVASRDKPNILSVCNLPAPASLIIFGLWYLEQRLPVAPNRRPRDNFLITVAVFVSHKVRAQHGGAVAGSEPADIATSWI
jgi:hypothetical protein